MWLNLINYLFVRDILLLIKYMFTQVVNRWKKVLYQQWIFHTQVPMPSANANATNNWSKRAIEKREEYALLQE